MKRIELIEEYFEFFKSKNHKIIQNSSLIPENDPTVLFTTAGMHPLVPFLLGQPHPQGKRLVNVQRCIRTGDIEEVGDEVHHTFFEMLGNWSLGDYFKKESINYSFEFLTKILKIPKEKISVTCFKGDKDSPKDIESEKVWKDLGIKKIKFLGKKDNWWGPAGKTGPCGPDTEIFIEGIELWNNVLMQYTKDEKGNYNEAKQKNIDTGMGVERTIAFLQGYRDNYLTEIWKPIIQEIEKRSNKKYKGNEKAMRIIADHIKASTFIIADGIVPSNKEQGYILRRLIRRAINYGRELGIKNFTKQIAEPIFEIYKDYPQLEKNKNKILEELKKEEERFNQTIETGFSIFNKLIKDKKEMDCKESFLLYQSYGFPVELIEEECKKRKIKFVLEDFEKECKAHQELSRTASAGQFKSGLADHSEATTKLHTAAHLLLQALKIILKDNNIIQKGSNINAERLRLDFLFPRKLEELEIKQIENLVNKQIQDAIPVIRKEMSLQEAKKRGACGIFDDKYGEQVSVYSIGDFSKEICTGPHVKNTKELGKFKIIKEESSSSGVRRIKAIVE
jgi:alanyl-tRNA synthetase